MGKTKVTVKKGKQTGVPQGKPRLIGKVYPRTKIHVKYNSKGERRKPGWK